MQTGQTGQTTAEQTVGGQANCVVKTVGGADGADGADDADDRRGRRSACRRCHVSSARDLVDNILNTILIVSLPHPNITSVRACNAVLITSEMFAIFLSDLI